MSADFLARKAAALRARAPLPADRLDAFRARALAMPRPPSFGAALAAGPCVAVIAEFKRASPSAGAITDERPADVVRAYAAAGARAASILTDGPDFGGDLDDLRAAAPLLPALRKDFVLAESDVYVARAAGAAAVLLIAALLDDAELSRLHAAARDVGLDALVEVHDTAELERAVACGASIIGVNSRNLHTLTVDAAVLRTLAPRIPRGVVAVAESGIRDAETIAELRALGYRGFLIGERFMAAGDPGGALAQLLSAPEQTA